MKTIGIKIANQNPPVQFDTEIELTAGQKVIVESPNGAEWGVVVGTPFACRKSGNNNLVLRVATDDDKKSIIQLIKNAEYAERITKQKILRHNLEMKVVSSRYTMDGNKLLIQFTADGRVDFRELVKDLATTLRVRIELRQISPREHTKTVGALGPCGLPCCCTRFACINEGITVKMAKAQNITMNPSKMNGMCGRLMCCLTYEKGCPNKQQCESQ